MSATCPTCLRAIRPVRVPASTPVDTRALSDRELIAHYKKTAPREDLAFFLRHARLSAALRTDAIALMELTEPSGRLAVARPEFYRRLRALQERWRVEAGARERAAITRAAA